MGLQERPFTEKGTLYRLPGADIALACKYVSGDEIRYFLDGLCVDGELIVASDGRRIFQMANMGLPDGFYRVVKSGVRETWLYRLPDEQKPKYPDWRKAMPGGKVIAESTVTGGKREYHATAGILLRMLPDGFGINLDYVRDLGPHEYHVFIHGDSKETNAGFPIVRLVSEKPAQTIVIMPMSLRDWRDKKRA